MEDKLLKEFFKKERWQKAIDKGVDKKIDKDMLKKLCSPEARLELYERIKNDKYAIMPPHEAQIPKDDGSMRTVYVNEGIDRVILSIINDMLFEFCQDMIHQNCVSYQKGIGCGKVVKHCVSVIKTMKNNDIGIKADLSKYFDSVPIKYIDKCFDDIEVRTGKSKIIDILREYYHMNYVFDMDMNLIEKYTSLRQGCAVAAFLADAVLYDIDDMISKMDVFYIRYSDDILIVGNEWQKAQEVFRKMLNDKGLVLNPKKVENLHKDKWFKFLGFNIKDDKITLSKNRVKTFQKEVEKRTIKTRSNNERQIIENVQRYLYKGVNGYSWATSILSVINVEKDIDTLNEFVLDCIRATMTGKKKIGGLGSVNDKDDYTILRGTGRNVTSNRNKTSRELDGYKSIRCMRNALITSRQAYDALVMQM